MFIQIINVPFPRACTSFTADSSVEALETDNIQASSGSTSRDPIDLGSLDRPPGVQPRRTSSRSTAGHSRSREVDSDPRQLGSSRTGGAQGSTARGGGGGGGSSRGGGRSGGGRSGRGLGRRQGDDSGGKKSGDRDKRKKDKKKDKKGSREVADRLRMPSSERQRLAHADKAQSDASKAEAAKSLALAKQRKKAGTSEQNSTNSSGAADSDALKVRYCVPSLVYSSREAQMITSATCVADRLQWVSLFSAPKENELNWALIAFRCVAVSSDINEEVFICSNSCPHRHKTSVNEQ